jgi:hypothetical protein
LLLPSQHFTSADHTRCADLYRYLFSTLSLSITSSLDHHQSLSAHYTHLLATYPAPQDTPQLTKTHLSHFHLLSLQERIQRLHALITTSR